MKGTVYLQVKFQEQTAYDDGKYPELNKGAMEKLKETDLKTIKGDVHIHVRKILILRLSIAEI